MSLHDAVNNLEAELDKLEAEGAQVLGHIQAAVLSAFRSAISFFRHVFGEPKQATTGNPAAGGQTTLHANKD